MILSHYVLFHLAQLFIHGNGLFPKRWNWQIYKHLNFHFIPIAVSYTNFSHNMAIGFLLDGTQQYTSVLFGKIPHELATSGKRAAKQPLCTLF